MTGRHRRPSTTTTRIARTGALTVMMTAPLAAVAGTAVAAPSAGDGDTTGWTTHDHPETLDAGTAPADDSAVHTAAMTTPLDSRHAFHTVSDADDSDSGDSGSDGEDDGDGSDSDGTDSDDSASGDSGSDDSGSDSGSVSTASGASGAKWDKLAKCESTENWAADTGNGFKGGLQFSDSTWRGFGGKKFAPTADQASREQQIEVAKKVQSEQGWSAWPSCSRKLGLGS